jgi:GEVED domain/Secretion system C-terminal sorting domain
LHTILPSGKTISGKNQKSQKKNYLAGSFCVICLQAGNYQFIKNFIMQPKFTHRSLVYFFTRLSMLMLTMALTTLISNGQKAARNANQQAAELQKRTEQKLKIAQYGRPVVAAPAGANNDRGITNTTARPARTFLSARPEAICATFTGDFVGATTMPNRLFRPGATTSCVVPYTFPGTFAQTVPFRTFTYTNNTGLTQCGTFTLSTVGAGSNAQFVIYSNSFNPAALATNYLADPGVSGVELPTSCQATIASGATIVLMVMDLGTPASSFSLTIDFPICASVPCAATPTPGNTISSVPTVCAGINFSLSLQNATAGSGVTYQWQSGPSATGPWTNVAGGTGATLATTQTAATFYQCVVTCAGNGSGTSTPVSVALTPASGCYCIPPASDCTDDDVITRVRISTLDNASACSAGPPAGYGNFTALPAPIVYAGAGNPIIVNKPTIWSEGVAVWIDYNKNGNFEAAELTSLGTVPAATPALTGTINIPTSALTGLTRMRVRMQFAAVPTGPCTALGFGETEDYTVDIQPCVPITITSSPSSATIACGGNTTFTVTTSGSLPSYVWEWRPNASAAWQFVPNAAPFSGVNTATLTLTNMPQTFNGAQFRAVVVGGCSATDVSGAATLTVNAIVPVVTPSSATICNPSIQQLTLTNTLGNTDLLSEGFEGTSLPAGWNMQNLSTPIGTFPTWVFGNAVLAPAQNGTPNSYALGNFQNVAGNNTISNWLITPALPIKNGDIFKFWTRTVAGAAFPDRLEVRMNTTNTTNVGATNASIGDFTTLLLTINPTLTTTGYPETWTEFTITVSGLGAPTPAGRFAFRYFVTNGGPAGANSDNIGIDNVTFTSTGGPAQGLWTGTAGTMWSNAGATTPYVTGTPATTIWVTPAASTSYGVSFTTLTPCTSAVTNVPISVVQPAVVTTQPANFTACVGTNATFTVAASGGPNTYQWQRSIDGGLTWTNISGATTTTLTVTGVTQANSGYRYRAVVTAAPCVGSVNSNAAILTVLPLPVVTLTATDLSLTPGQFSTITASSVPAAASYVWQLNGSPVAGTGNSQTIGIDQIGTYTVTAVTAGPPACASASAASITIGAEASDRLWIYPNPSSGAFQVRLYFSGNPANKRAVYLYNEAGQLVVSREFDLFSSQNPYLRMDFDLGNVSRGTYVVKVVDKFTGRIVSGLVVIQ